MAIHAGPTRSAARGRTTPERNTAPRPATRAPRPPWLPSRPIAPAPTFEAAGRKQRDGEGPEGRSQATASPPAELPRPNRTGLPDGLKAGVEALSGLAMDDVRVHRNSSEPARLGALAFAQGSDIHLGPGQEQHLPHEAWHVVQQKQGRAEATGQLKTGVAINDDSALELEADILGTLAQRGGPAGAVAPLLEVRAPAQAIAQRVVMNDQAFLQSLGLTEQEIEALEGGTLEDKLLSGIYYNGLKNNGVINDKHHAAIEDSMSRSTEMTETQFAGLRHICAFIVDEFPVEYYSFIGIGRSPVLILELLKQEYDAATYEMPIGGMKNMEPNFILNDMEERVALELLIDEHINPQAGEAYVIVDYAENGGSINTFKTIFEDMYPDSLVEMMPIFLNEATEIHGDRGAAFAELRDNDDAVAAFVKRLRLEIGKQGLAGFEKFDIADGIGERAPVATPTGVNARRGLISAARAAQ